MSNRGRPKTPDVLTPREYEVLALIREGLANREIAERLGISLAGAKFHVSEIITKLGVESREEAAAWRPEQARRWSFAPLASVSWPGKGLGSMMTPQASVAFLAVLAVAGLTAAGMLIAEGDQPGPREGRVAVLPTPTPTGEDACRGATTLCMTHDVIRTEVTTLAEAAALSSFVPVLPAYIPFGFGSRTIVYSSPGVSTLYYPDGRSEQIQSPFKDTPYDAVSTTYESTDGYLAVRQGYSDVAPDAWWDWAPEQSKGSLELGGEEVLWLQGGPKPGAHPVSGANGGSDFAPEDWDSADSTHTIFWTVSAVQTGTWEAGPDGVKHSVYRPLEYLISSNVLSLDELLKIAASVIE